MLLNFQNDFVVSTLACAKNCRNRTVFNHLMCYSSLFCTKLIQCWQLHRIATRFSSVVFSLVKTENQFCHQTFVWEFAKTFKTLFDRLIFLEKNAWSGVDFQQNNKHHKFSATSLPFERICFSCHIKFTHSKVTHK